MSISNQNLVVYKSQAAKVVQAADKIELNLENGKTVKVRDKDITFLHEGPFQFSELEQDDRQLQDAWELSQGECLSLSDLAELLNDEFSPKGAWNAWCTLQDGVYFEGSLEQIQARSAEAVQETLKQREEKQKKQAEKAAFIERLKNKDLQEQDFKQLTSIENIALEFSQNCPLLKELKLQQLPHVARKLLIELGAWSATTNLEAVKILRDRDKEPHANFHEQEVILMDQNNPSEGRMDLTHLQAWAIDDENSNDPDDAISMDGEFIWVHIADVADLVRIDSDLDKESRERAANLYLPEWTSPMLPEGVTRQRGLGLHEVSPALSFKIQLQDHQAQLVQSGPSLVKVTRTSYNAVDDILESSSAQSSHEDLHQLYKSCEAFDEARRQNGSLELNLPEVKIDASQSDEVHIDLIPKGKSRILVKNAMLMCGQAVAKYAHENDLAIPFSVQAAPQLEEEHRELRPEVLLDAMVLRRHMQPSELNLEPGLHAGLGLEPYTQCTSPLRRYSDLLVHQQLRAHWAGESSRDREALLEALGGVKESSRHLRRTERFSKQHWTLHWFHQHSDWQGEAIVTAVEDRGVIVLIPELAYEQRIFIESKKEVGESTTLQVKRVDFDSGKVIFNEIKN